MGLIVIYYGGYPEMPAHFCRKTQEKWLWGRDRVKSVVENVKGGETVWEVMEKDK